MASSRKLTRQRQRQATRQRQRQATRQRQRQATRQRQRQATRQRQRQATRQRQRQATRQRGRSMRGGTYGVSTTVGWNGTSGSVDQQTGRYLNNSTANAVSGAVKDSGATPQTIATTSPEHYYGKQFGLIK